MITEISPTLLPYGQTCHVAGRWFDRSAGRLVGHEADEVMRTGHISVVNDFSLPPRSFFIGQDSAAIACFGEDWAMEAEVIGAHGIPDWEAEQRLNQAYFNTMKTGERQSHFIKETLDCTDGPKDITYFRTLTPVYVGNDSRLVLCSIDIIEANN